MTNETASRANGEARPDLTDIHMRALRLWGILCAMDILTNDNTREASEASLCLIEVAKEAANNLTKDLEKVM